MMRKSLDIMDIAFSVFIICVSISMLVVAWIGIQEYMNKNIDDAVCIDGKLVNKVPDRNDVYKVIDGYYCKDTNTKTTK